MRERYLKLLAIAMMAIVSVGMVSSCGGDDDKDDPTDPDTPINPVEPGRNEAMSPSDQKEYLEKVALEFMDLTPASDFTSIADLGMYINDTYGDDYDWSTVEDWAEDIFDDLRESLGTTSTETDRWGYTYVYTNYKALLRASNFTGHFTAYRGGWVYEKANDLQFIFNDKSGRQCVLELQTKGSEKKVHLANVDDYDYWNHSIEYYDRTQLIIAVPENITVTLTQGGSPVVKTTVKLSLGSISGEEFDISRGSITASSTTELNNGYKFEVSQVAYTPNGSASASFVMSKGGTSLVSIGASADASKLPSVNVSELSGDNFDFDEEFDDSNAKNAYVKLDILGKVQLQGTISDVRKFADYLDMANDNDESEKTFKSYVNQANALADVNLFYNGSSTKQATVQLEAFFEEDWYERYWECEPVITFYDGSSYSTFEAFFNDKDFKNTVNTFKKLANRYANLVDERIDW